MASAMMKSLSGLFWFLMLAGWTLDLAGIARLTHLCRDKTNPYQGNPLISSKSQRESQCGYDYSFDWWTIALQFLALTLVLVTIFTRRLNRGVVTSLLVISTVQLAITASIYVKMRNQMDLAKTLSSDEGKAVAVVVAGKITELVANYLWILFFARFVHDDVAPTTEDGSKPTSA
jgi:hypothetical protein